MERTATAALGILLSLLPTPALAALQGTSQERPQERQWDAQESSAATERRALERRLRQELLNHRADAHTAIDSTTVSALSPSWKIETEGNVTHTPLFDGERIFFADWTGTVWAVDAGSGETLWKKKVEEPRKEWAWHGFAGTGAQSEDVLYEASVEGNLFALDKDDGRVLWQQRFAEDEHAGNAGRLTYHDGIVLVPVQSVEEALTASEEGFEPDFRGHVVAYDARSGARLWNRWLARPPHDGAGVWSGFAIDPSTETLFFTTSNSYTGEAAPLSDSLVVADLRTGRIRGHRQVVGNDVWTMADPIGPDYAFGAAPQVFMAEREGQRRKLVAAGNKSGTFHVWDAASGEPVWSTVVGYGQVGGGIYAEASIGGDRIFLWGNNSFTHENPKEHPMDVAALDAATGRYVWKRKDAQPAALNTAGFLAADVYLVPSLDGRVRGYRASDGETIWTSGQHGSIGSSLAVSGDRLVFGTGAPKDLGAIRGDDRGVVAYGLDRQALVRLRDGGESGDADGSARVLALFAHDFRFEPERLSAKPGQDLDLMLVNLGDSPHAIAFTLPDGQAKLDRPARPGASGSLKLKAPNEPGRYEFYCPIAREQDIEMKGTLVVEKDD